jgi:hypothetical protein
VSPELKRVVAEVVAVEGIYLLQDTTAPSAYVVVVSKGGRLMAMTPTNELAPDRFLPTAKLTPLIVFVPE